MSNNHAGGGGAAPAPTPVPGGPVPADLADLLPEGFVLPEGVHLVHVPPVTPAAHAKGMREQADRRADFAQACEARLAKARENAAGQIAGLEQGVEEARAEAEAAADAAAEAEAEAGITEGGRA